MTDTHSPVKMNFYSFGCLVFVKHFRNDNHLVLAICVPVLLITCLVMLPAHAQDVSNREAVVKLSLSDYLHRVLRHNESIQAEMLSAEASHHKARSEWGAFEPQLEVSFTREANQRTNNYQQAVQLGQTYFDERNSIYDGGIESLLPTGGKIRLGATMSDLINNIGYLYTPTNEFRQQYQTFVGATFTQPLLKNAGFTSTLASLRLAALDSDIAFQEYRRQLMLTISRAESAYWNLYYAQEQLHFFDDSVKVAKTVLADSRQKLKAGQGSELDVMQARSGLALRETKRNDARQSYFDAMGSLQSLTGRSPIPNFSGPIGPTYRVVDIPSETNAPITYADGFQSAIVLNPDYLIQAEKMRQEEVRLGFAKNQLLPELDFKAAYGYNGLGDTPDDAWAVADSQNFPSWSVGLQLNIPLGGNIKGRHLLKAAKLSLQEAYVSLKGAQTEIANHLNVAIQQMRAWHQSIQSYQTVVSYNQELLQTELQQFKAGAVDGYKVLEAEADLLDARQNLANALVQYQDAIIKVQLADGEILKQWHVDISREELRRQTDALMNTGE